MRSCAAESFRQFRIGDVWYQVESPHLAVIHLCFMNLADAHFAIEPDRNPSAKAQACRLKHEDICLVDPVFDSRRIISGGLPPARTRETLRFKRPAVQLSTCFLPSRINTALLDSACVALSRETSLNRRATGDSSDLATALHSTATRCRG